jgi:Fic family protein
MANDELAIRFSNDTYAMKSEVAKALNTSLIDNIWLNIVQYRSQFTRLLSLKAIDHASFQVVITPTLNNHINNIERKLTKSLIRYGQLNNLGADLQQVNILNHSKALYWIAKKYNLSVSEEFFHKIILGNVSTMSPDKMILARYYSALKYINEHYHEPINEDLLAKLYSLISGNEELIVLYRTNEIITTEQKALIGKSYAAAPVARIEELMNNLYDFIANSDISPLLKAIIAYYFCIYIKPFESFSEEMGILILKSILAKNDFDNIPCLLDVESLLSDDQETITRIINEVKKTNDITYLVAYWLPSLEENLTSLLDALIAIETNVVKQEQHGDVFQEKPISEDEVIEQIKADEQQPIPSEKMKVDPYGTFDEHIALPSLPPKLDEVEATQVEEHLLEMNPSLKRSEAYFYARHCTIGKYYTIGQFKRSLGCAYETARTSMEHLASLGYYRKEMLKNKFIYTPIVRKK